MKISARNILKGTVRSVSHGAVNSEVTLEIGKGLVVVSVITKASAKRLRLKAGSTAYAVIKASDVLVGID